MLALAQTGVIVAGILGCGASARALSGYDLPLPAVTLVLLRYGFLFLLLPLLWIVVAMVVHQRESWSEQTRQLAFVSGVFLLVALVVCGAYGSISPWVQLWKTNGLERTWEDE